LDLGLDRSARLDEAAAPCIDLGGVNPKRNVTGSMGAMSRDRDRARGGLRLGGRLRVEDEEDTVATAEEQMPLGLAVEEGQSENAAVELFGGLKVAGIDRCFEHAVQVHHW
jgi:hypothetical protein